MRRVYRERLRSLGGFKAALSLAYPDHTWDKYRFITSIERKSQSSLLDFIRKLRPGQGTLTSPPVPATLLAHQSFTLDIKTNYYMEFLFSSNLCSTELDAYLKDERMAIEFQGLQHYFDTNILFDSLIIAQRDEQKVIAIIILVYYCKTNGEIKCRQRCVQCKE